MTAEMTVAATVREDAARLAREMQARLARLEALKRRIRAAQAAHA